MQAALEMSQTYWYVYLLLCDQKTFYIGMTDQPKQRLIQHKSKLSFYTKKFSDINFVYCEKYPDKYTAARREKQLKGWSRTKKQMLMSGALGYNTCAELVEELSRV